MVSMSVRRFDAPVFTLVRYVPLVEIAIAG
jgi:hypothetical protein